MVKWEAKVDSVNRGEWAPFGFSSSLPFSFSQQGSFGPDVVGTSKSEFWSDPRNDRKTSSRYIDPKARTLMPKGHSIKILVRKLWLDLLFLIRNDFMSEVMLGKIEWGVFGRGMLAIIDQDTFDHDKGQKSAISGHRLHWRLSTGFFASSPVLMCNLARRAP